MKEHKIIKNYIFNSFYQITSIIVPLITTPYLSRILGSEGIGEYSFAYSIATYFTPILKSVSYFVSFTVF